MRVLVVDDSSLFRRILSDVLGSLPDIEVVGQAPNGKIALTKIETLKPDLVTLDLEMPELDGLGVLEALQDQPSPPAVIVISAATEKGGQLTMKALDQGAFDFVQKPVTTNLDDSRTALVADLSHRIKALGLRLGVRSIMRGRSSAAAGSRPARDPAPDGPRISHPRAASPGSQAITDRMRRIACPTQPEYLLIGSSTGGPNALDTLLSALPGDLPVPVLIVQHMPPVFTASLAESLNAKSALTVREASDGDVPQRGHVYIAPGGHQMRLTGSPDGSHVIRINQDPPENNCRPAVDYLFRSVAELVSGRSLAVVLTGMGADGTNGLRMLKARGAIAVAQDEPSCVVYGMPKAVVDAGLADDVVSIDAMAGRITTILTGVTV